MTGQDVINYIQNNKLENEYVLDCELKFDVRLKDDSRLGYELNDFSDNMVDHYGFKLDGPRVIGKLTLEEALKLRGETTPFRCKAEESRWQNASACKDCQNKCEEYHQWDKEMKENKTMKTIKVKATDMSDRLNAEGKYCIKIKGEEFMSGESKEVILDASDLNIDQIGAIAGFLDAVFDDSHIDKLTGVSIVKLEDDKDNLTPEDIDILF